MATASSAHRCCGFSTTGAINGNNRGPWGNGEGWNDATENVLPDWFQVDFAGTKTIDEIDVFSLHDNYTQENTPTETQTFSLYGLLAFEVQYWNGSSWVTIPGGSVTGNNKVWRKFTFSAISTSKIRVWITSVPDSWSRLVEVQAWEAGSGGAAANVEWTNTVGVSVSGNNLTKTAATDWYNARASSTQGITTGDGYVEFTASETTTNRMLGLGEFASGYFTYSNIRYAMYMAGSVLYTDEYGSLTNVGSYATGDKLRVAIEGGAVKYYKNGALLRTSALAPVYPLYANVAMYTNGSTLTGAVIDNGSGSGGGSAGQINWLVTDHLGTPRIIIDQTGTLANVKRHDYLPFGEELFAGTGGRTAALGYAGGDGVRQQFTQKERDAETGLDYFGARYYASMQGRFTSVDPENAGANPDVPQSWNAYGYAGGNPVLFSDPDGREYLVCGPNGNDGKCTTVSDEQFWAERKELKKTGNIYTGSGDFFETGQIKNADGEVVATYAQISIDDRVGQQIFAIRRAVDPIPIATAQFFGLSAVLGTGGGLLYYAVVPYLAPTVTTLGLSGTGTGAAATEASLSGLSTLQLNTIIRGTQKQLLNKLFGQGMQGAQQALQSGEVPAGLTRQALLVYRELARRAIEKGIDKGGVQAARLKIIEEALKKLE